MTAEAVPGAWPSAWPVCLFVCLLVTKPKPGRAYCFHCVVLTTVELDVRAPVKSVFIIVWLRLGTSN